MELKATRGEQEVHTDSDGENMRRCPTCRSLISVMATRCRHCGEKVSRPRTEEEKFTIQDLGGVSDSSYKVSASVMSAIEAFREEELDVSGPADPLGRQGHGGGLPTLDSEHRALAEAVMEDPAERMRKEQLRRRKPAAAARRRSQDDLLRPVLYVLGALIGLVVLGIAFSQVRALLSREAPVVTQTYVNHALEWLEDGQHATIDALKEANDAIAADYTPKNLEIAETVRAAFVKEVEGLLNCVPYDREKISYASRLAANAIRFDSSHTITDLAERVRMEVAAFKLVLIDIDDSGAKATATFELKNPFVNETEQTVEEGDYVADRFLVKSITSRQVIMVDEKVMDSSGNYRRLSIRVLDPITGL